MVETRTIEQGVCTCGHHEDAHLTGRYQGEPAMHHCCACHCQDFEQVEPEAAILSPRRAELIRILRETFGAMDPIPKEAAALLERDGEYFRSIARRTLSRDVSAADAAHWLAREAI